MTFIEDTIGHRFHYDGVLYEITGVDNNARVHMISIPKTEDTYVIDWSKLVENNTKIYNRNNDPEMFL